MRKQHLGFRHDEVSYITKRWKSLENMSLVGVGSVGKSNLLHHLTDKDVHRKYFNTPSQDVNTIILAPYFLGPLPLDGNNTEQYKCWAGIELIMHRLYMAFYPFEFLKDEDAQRFFELYQALQNGNNPLFAYMGLRYLELGLKILFDNNIRIVLMFDEFDEFLSIMPSKFFQILRGIRDNYKNNLLFLTFTRTPLPTLVNRLNIDYYSIEPFVELFTDNILYVGPYNDEDALAMLNVLIKRNPENIYPDHVLNFLLHASGRFAGIMRASFRVLESLGSIHPQNIYDESLIQRLSQRTSVKVESKTIWLSLSSIEQQVLKTVAQLETYTESATFDKAIKELLQKRLLTVDRATETLTITPPIFRHFIHTNPTISE
jgi:hypothetical protein